jgi:hypothetical protein
VLWPNHQGCVNLLFPQGAKMMPPSYENMFQLYTSAAKKARKKSQ